MEKLVQQMPDGIVKKWSYTQTEYLNNKVVGTKVSDIIVTNTLFVYQSETDKKQGKYESKNIERYDLALADIKSVKTQCNVLTKSTPKGLGLIISSIILFLAIVALMVVSYFLSFFNWLYAIAFVLPIVLLIIGIHKSKHPLKETTTDFTLSIITRGASEKAFSINDKNSNDNGENAIVLLIPSGIALEIARTIGLLCVGK